MKNILIVVLFIATIAFGTLYFVEHGRASKTSTQLTEASSKLGEAERLVREQQESVEKARFAEQKAEVLQSTLKEASTAVNESTKQVKELEQSLATAKTNKSSNPLAGMFSDPKMKAMIKKQSEAMMGPMVDKSYSAFIKEQNLSPEQSAALKDILKKKMMAGAEMGMSMMSGDLDEAKRKEIADQIKTDTEAADAQIKELLGEDNYAAFEKYEKSTGERVVVGQFKDQLSGSDNLLTASQEQQLIQAMNQDRTNFKWTTDYQNKKPGSADYAQMFTEDRVDAYEREKTEFDKQFLAKAAAILTPEQLKSFESFQDTQRQMQMVGMKMAAQMFAPKKQ
ncbi:MAG: hypothetical protein HOP33_22000 [Verrucomicrobia bacterium]|nr:hypothetical protein [Verrucomicrobiota bacterium]